MTDTNTQYLDLQGLEDYSSLSISTIRSYIKYDSLPHFKVRGKILVRQSEFDKWMEGYRVDSQDLDKLVDEVMQSVQSEY
jgi:hypothetical protein